MRVERRRRQIRARKQVRDLRTRKEGRMRTKHGRSVGVPMKTDGSPGEKAPTSAPPDAPVIRKREICDTHVSGGGGGSRLVAVVAHARLAG